MFMLKVRVSRQFPGQSSKFTNTSQHTEIKAEVKRKEGAPKISLISY